MSIYQIDVNYVANQLTPPKLRKPKLTAWLKVLVSPLLKFNQNSFIAYKEGDSSLDYDSFTIYNFGDRVRWTDKSIYEAKKSFFGGTDPSNTSHWTKVNDIFIACDERIKYSSQKILFEYALNKYFITSGIYITNNFVGAGNTFVMNESSTSNSLMPDKSVYQVDYLGTTTHYATSIFDYTINFPIADYAALGTDAENIIRSFADKYNLSGMRYNILTF